MPVISTFYGMVVLMFYFDNKKHNRPHIHVQYGEFEVVLSINEGDVLEGDFPISRMKLIQAWIEIHREELLEDWELAVTGQKVNKIEPLR